MASAVRYWKLVFVDVVLVLVVMFVECKGVLAIGIPATIGLDWTWNDVVVVVM